MEIEATTFDQWYDSEVERITKELPHPETFPFPTITYPVNFSELKGISIVSAVSDRVILHTVSFKKMRKGNKYYWERD